MEAVPAQENAQSVTALEVLTAHGTFGGVSARLKNGVDEVRLLEQSTLACSCHARVGRLALR
eukprot:CAMPEP_0170139856 /NCGR_PEP_ID=MMETSP0033_2-20121228/5959_1 /TAXON_ID=195969 /ORGANISM="Dolichomastix tenuilepis, Strain CCMP3274" /LENGTH=61 /DNA_ID=CAMNT_0010376013 /DNA_START=169 /DNA_END=351 /DNA_ORIENTATION=+